MLFCMFGLVGLASLLAVLTTAQDPAYIANLVHFWDYGRSPPVYPSPEGQGNGDWAQAYASARQLVSQMTLKEKASLTIGVASTSNGCGGNIAGISRLGFPGMCLQDSGNGVHAVEGASSYPYGIHAGASWNRNLTLARARYMGQEFKAKGANVVLGPVVGPLGRVAIGGRNSEGLSNDPYLDGALVYETVRGLQDSVIACTKHYIANEQETNRNPSYLVNEVIGFGTSYNESVSSNVDDKTMHEAYLWPFMDALRAGTGSIMCSYNRVNNSYACQNSKTLNGLLKTELGFEGFVMSDWYAEHAGVASALAGLDLVMPYTLVRTNPAEAVNNGSMPVARLNDMATRILAQWYRFAPVGKPGFGIPYNATMPHNFVNARTLASASTLLQGAIEGHVLVKNSKGVLPLKAPQFLSLFGYDATSPLTSNPGSTSGFFNAGWESVYDPGVNLLAISAGLGPASVPEAAYNGTLWSAGGSGASTPAYVVDPFQAFTQRARQDNTWLAWDFVSQHPQIDPASDACIVMINEFSSEGYDRAGLADPQSDNPVLNVAAQCSNTIVVIHNVYIRLVDAFYNHPNVTGIIYAHLPGQETGTALVELIYGQQSFSGRLPYTVAKNASDYGSLELPTRPDNTSEYHTQSNFTEGVYIDYKAFMKNNIQPRFAFGFGLTYASFKYSNMCVTLAPKAALTTFPLNATIVQGGNPHLYDIIATVTATVSNVGKVAAAEVAQLYVGIPESPPRQLRGFDKQLIRPGRSVQVSFSLTRRDLSIWNVVAQLWELQSGTYHMQVGKDVLDIPLSMPLAIKTV